MKGVIAAAILVTGTAICAGTSVSQEKGLPEPSGPYAVGTAHLLFVDESRPELFTDDPDDQREVTVRAWYPADPEIDAPVAPYYEDAAEMVRRYGYPPEFMDLDTHSMQDVPVSQEEDAYRVVLFNHGWGEHAVQNTILMEELASHGYIVFSLAHHYEAKYWAYPDGRLGYLSIGSSRFQEIMQEQGRPEIMELYRLMFTTRGAAAQESLFIRTVNAMPTFLGEGPRIWAGDIVFIIDELDSLNSVPGLFEGKLDLQNVGAMGMSLGGAAAAQACIGESRIKAVMNIDGGLLADLPDTTIKQPAMFMNSRRFIDYVDVFASHVEGDAYILTIADADHYDFTDFTLLHREHPLMGTVEGRRMIDIMNECTLAFFDFYLKGKESDLLSGKSKPHPEADLRARERP